MMGFSKLIDSTSGNYLLLEDTNEKMEVIYALCLNAGYNTYRCWVDENNTALVIIENASAFDKEEDDPEFFIHFAEALSMVSASSVSIRFNNEAYTFIRGKKLKTEKLRFGRYLETVVDLFDKPTTGFSGQTYKITRGLIKTHGKNGLLKKLEEELKLNEEVMPEEKQIIIKEILKK